MPRATMPSAIDLISCSLTLHPNVFQEFQPIGGVAARMAGAGVTPPASSLAAASGVALDSPPEAVAAAPGCVLGWTAKPPGSPSPFAAPTALALGPPAPPPGVGAAAPEPALGSGPLGLAE